jgi:hypothetical protein
MRQGAEFHRGIFWAQEYAVSTIGFEIEQIQYIRDQEEADGTGNSFKFGN